MARSNKYLYSYLIVCTVCCSNAIVHHRPLAQLQIYVSSYKSIGKQAILVEYILHQYGISVAESQRFLLAKHTKWREARINGCFCRLIPCQLISYTQQLEILAKALPQVNDFLPSVRKTFSRTKSFSKNLQTGVTNESITNEGSQTNLATCNLFPVAMMSFICQLFLYFWSHS